MKNFISVVYIKTNSLSDEKVSVGLFAISESHVSFNYSKDKLKHADSILQNNLYNPLLKTLDSIVEKAHEFNNNKEHELISENIFSLEYFEYLNKSVNGIIEFMPPQPFAKNIDNKEFQKLFKLFIGIDLMKQESKQVNDFKVKVKNYLSLSAFDKTDKNYKIEPEKISGVYSPTIVDFICKNGGILLGQTIDFNATVNSIDKNIYEYKNLISSLEVFAKEKELKDKGKYNLFFNEPIEKEQKKVFDNINKDKNKPFNFAHVDVIKNTAKEIENNEYTKFSLIFK
ncbi:MAG: hypothetical protein PHD97_07430 [Bacteroidales bacterium]|nr:hypothetical protein [Bacteroidales bacterium]